MGGSQLIEMGSGSKKSKDDYSGARFRGRSIFSKQQYEVISEDIRVSNCGCKGHVIYAQPWSLFQVSMTQ